MSNRLIFSVKTPVGYRVSLSRDRWRQIIRYKHPALKGHEKAIRSCLCDPVSVRVSTKDAEVHLYYSQAERGYLVVAVAPSADAGDRFVVTAYFSRNIKEGTDLWKK